MSIFEQVDMIERPLYFAASLREPLFLERPVIEEISHDDGQNHKSCPNSSEKKH